MNRFFETIQEEVYPFLESCANKRNQEEVEKQDIGSVDFLIGEHL